MGAQGPGCTRRPRAAGPCRALPSSPACRPGRTDWTGLEDSGGTLTQQCSPSSPEMRAKCVSRFSLPSVHMLCCGAGVDICQVTGLYSTGSTWTVRADVSTSPDVPPGHGPQHGLLLSPVCQAGQGVDSAVCQVCTVCTVRQAGQGGDTGGHLAPGSYRSPGEMPAARPALLLARRPAPGNALLVVDSAPKVGAVGRSRRK